MEVKKVVVSDIDGTLTRNRRCLQWMEGPIQWMWWFVPGFDRLVGLVSPIRPNHSIIHHFWMLYSVGFEIHLVSNRPNHTRLQTVIDLQILGVPPHTLHLPERYEKNGLFKRRKIRELDPLVVYGDHPPRDIGRRRVCKPI